MTTQGPETIAVRRRVLVHGRVQAVGFRASCLRRATDAGLGGWVRNTERGDVEAAFEGPASTVDALVRWCRQGPSWAPWTASTSPTNHCAGRRRSRSDEAGTSTDPGRGETPSSRFDRSRRTPRGRALG